MRQIVHLDIDNFFISCTVLQMPELADKPLIIGGTSNRGIVASSSVEAQKFGVRPGMPTRLAQRYCPNATVLKGDFDLFSKMSETVNDIILDKAPVHERSTMDEFYLDMTGLDRFFGTALFTKELASTITHETGLSLSYGLSINKTVAKMATNHIKPRGHLEIEKPYVQPFLDPQSIKNIPQVGDVTYKLLRRLRVKLIETLRQIPRASLHELLGKAGLSLSDKAHGIDPTPIIPYSVNTAYTAERTFDRDTQDIPELKALIISLVEELGFKLRLNKQMCSKLTVRIRYANSDTETASKRMAFTAQDDVLIEHATQLFDKLYERRMLLRLFGLKVSGLVNGSYQVDLFSDNTKLLNLYEAMDRMKTRYNDPKIVRRATGFSSYEDH